MLFEILGLMEYYHPRMQLRLQLARIMILNLLNLYSLIWALFGKINGMTVRLGEIKKSQEVNDTETETAPLQTTTAPSTRATLTSKLPSSTIDSITESVFSRITDVLNLSSTTDYPATDYPTEPTENYDYDNPNYFEVDEQKKMSSTTMEPSVSPFSSFTESIYNFTTAMADNFTDMFYIDPANDTDFSGDNGDLFENSNFNLSNLIDSYVLNASNITAAGYSRPAFNFTYVEPILSAYEQSKYSAFQHEQSSFIVMDNLNSSTKLEMRKLCWETMFGQELVKLTVMDLVSETCCCNFE